MFKIESIPLKDNRIVNVRLLQTQDAEALYRYLNGLSAASRSRFGPHPFDRHTVQYICNHLTDDIQRYIASIDDLVVAYMLIKQGMIDADGERYAQHNMFFDAASTVTYAPSVADDFQNSGLGSKMFAVILDLLKQQGCNNIILWGGVQGTNARAIHYYEKHGFIRVANFWHDNKDNIDMLLNINL